MPGARIARPPVHRITLAQFAILVPLSASLAVVDEVCAYSAALGGLIAILPQAWFAWQAFRWRGGSKARAMVRASYVGEVSKFALSAAGFAAVFMLVRPINGPAVFAGFLARARQGKPYTKAPPGPEGVARDSPAFRQFLAEQERRDVERDIAFARKLVTEAA